MMNMKQQSAQSVGYESFVVRIHEYMLSNLSRECTWIFSFCFVECNILYEHSSIHPSIHCCRRVLSAVNKSYPCPFHMFGCKTTPSYNQLKKHQTTCDFILVHCDDESCNWIGPSNNYQQHLIESHDVTDVECRSNLSGTFLVPLVFNSDETCFYVLRLVFSDTHIEFVCVRSYLHSSRCVNSIFTIDVFPLSKTFDVSHTIHLRSNPCCVNIRLQSHQDKEQVGFFFFMFIFCYSSWILFTSFR